MRGWALVLVGATVLTACGSGAGYDDNNRGEVPCDGGMTLELAATPSVMTRGEATDVVVHWRTLDPVNAPYATLSLDQDRIEVEIPLLEQAGDEHHSYQGSTLNPFGLGAPVGSIDVLTQGKPPVGCNFALTATTKISLR